VSDDLTQPVNPNESYPDTTGDVTQPTNGEVKRHYGTNGTGGDTATGAPAPPRPPKYDETVVAHRDRGSAVTEEYRSIRQQLMASCPEGRFGYFVTSASSGEGKTTTCVNLAMVLAERTDRKTVLVDATLGSGKLSSLLNAPPQPGLIELLHGQATLEQVTQPTAHANLSYIPAGKADNGHHSELLAPQLAELVSELRRQYDHVLFDTPAIQASPTASIVGGAGLDALLVVRMYKTRRESVSRALRALGGSNVTIGGMILNERKSFIPGAVYRNL
jgi:polysaccharide biosynthesis transport protein